MSYKYLDAAALLGKTITSISNDKGRLLHITTDDGKQYVMSHDQDCCENVRVHDVRGELESLVGSPLTVAREETTRDWPSDVATPEDVDSATWSIYYFSTDTANVRIRWLGESNGYYSESVQIDEVE